MNNVLLVKFRYHSTVNVEMFAQYIFSHNAKDARKYDNCMTFEIIIEKKEKNLTFLHAFSMARKYHQMMYARKFSYAKIFHSHYHRNKLYNKHYFLPLSMNVFCL